MPEVGFTNLFVVSLVALLAPLLLGLAPRARVPAVVLEIIAGVVLGPSVLGWVEADLVVSIVAVLGLAFLLFLAGLEIDTRRLRGPLLRLALVGYGVTLTLGLAVGGGLDLLGWVSSPVLLAVALSATSLGLIVPVLKDARKLESGLGQTVVAAASVADFTAIVLLSLFFSTSESGIGTRIALLVLFSGLVSLTAVAALAVGRLHRLGETVTRLQDTTAEIRVRAAVLLLVGFVALAAKLGLETILEPSWPVRSSGWSTRTPRRTRGSGPSSRPSATASSSRSSSSPAGCSWTSPVWSTNPRPWPGCRSSPRHSWWSAVCRPSCSSDTTTAAQWPPRGCCRPPRCRSW